MDKQICESTLFQIAENCPRSFAAYLMCYQNADHDLYANLTKQIVEKEKSMSWTKFRNDVKALARQGLLEWHENKGAIEVTLAAYDI